MKLQDSIKKVETHLSALENQKLSQVAFNWEGIDFKAVAENNADGSACIKLDARLGRLFFTIENAANRAMAIERLYANNRLVDGAYTVTKTGDVFYKNLTKTSKQSVGNDLLSAISVILLQSGAHMRALRSYLKK